MRRDPRLKVGDVFTVPIDEFRVGYGQVAGTYSDAGYYLAIFARAYPNAEAPSLVDVAADQVAFLALSFDAKLAAGHWKVVGHEKVRNDMPLPAYKESVGMPGRVDVVDYSGQRRRHADESESKRLPNRKIVAPVRLERALRALHGVEPWQEIFDELRPLASATAARLFGQPPSQSSGVK